GEPREQAKFPQGGGASDLFVEPRTRAVGPSCHPWPGTVPLSRTTSPAPAKSQVRCCLSLQRAVCWGRDDVREVRGAAGGGRPWQDAALLLNPLPSGCSPRASPPAA